MKLRTLGNRALRPEGFTLFEALIAVVLMGMILSILGTVIAQWIPSWKAGFARTQQAELAGLALDRIAADLSAAEFITPLGGTQPIFKGSPSSATFVRTAIGPNAAANGAGPGSLEIVRYYDSADEGGLVRARAPFSPAVTNVFSDDFKFSGATLLLRSPLHVSFAFAGSDRTWKDTWSDAATLPAAVRITLRNEDKDEAVIASTAVLIHVNAPASCASADASDCTKHLEKSNSKPSAGGGANSNPPATGDDADSNPPEGTGL